MVRGYMLFYVGARVASAISVGGLLTPNIVQSNHDEPGQTTYHAVAKASHRRFGNSR